MIERVVLVPPAAPGSLGDEGMMRGALALLEGFPVRLVNPDPGPGWTSVLADVGRKPKALTEIHMPISDYRSELRAGDLLLFIGADVVDGSCGLEPALSRIDLMAEAVLHGLPVFVACSFRSHVDRSIIQRLRLLPDIRFLIRDVHSLENFQRQTGLSAEYFPDLSFFSGATSSPLSDEAGKKIADARARFSTVIGLNFAEHSFRSFHDVHDIEHRRKFVRSVLTELSAGYPDAFFVLFSNDNRNWENHPSDAAFSDLAAEWIDQSLGEGRHLKLPSQIGYGGNIGLLASVDFLLTGRMHLSLAAFQVGTLPFVLMGEGKGYSSADKMRGAFATNMRTTSGVITEISAIRERISEALAMRPMIEETMAAAARMRKADCDAARERFTQSLGDGGSMPPRSQGERDAASIAAFAMLLRQEEELRSARTRIEQLSEAERANTTALEAMSEGAKRREAEMAEGAKRLVIAAREAAVLGDRHEHANAVLTRARAQMAEELRRTAARPWRPLKRAIQSGVLKFMLLFRGLMSDRTVSRLRRSLAKRKPRRFTYAWEATLAQAWGTEAPVDPLLDPVVRNAGAPLGTVVAFNALLGLAAMSAPFSKRRAERFRKSAEKRDPFRFRTGKGNTKLRMTSLAGRGDAWPSVDPARARRILVADYRIPRPDLSAGEKATFGLIADLCAIGFEVVFLPTDMNDVAPYREALEALGAKVITREQGHSWSRDYLRAEGAQFGTFYFIRVDVAEALLTSAKEVAPDARIIFHAPDLYFLRELRSAELDGDSVGLKAAERTKVREMAIMQASDHVVLVSPAEVPYLSDMVPRSRISVFPALYSPVVATPAGHNARQHIFFLGGFKHRPNADAVKWFVEKVWPAVNARLPKIEFHIVGAQAPADVIALAKRPGVRFVGYVKDLGPILAGYRLSVAPLRYGAGIKGKLGAAMGAGVPCVSTTIGTEGMGIVDGVHAMVRDDPGGFAEAVVALYGDPALWETISEKGRRLIEDRFGDAANQSAFCRVLDDAGALPLDMYVAWCQAAEPAPLPAPDPAEHVAVSIIVPVHNQWALTRACLNSVLRAIRGSGIICEVILADDGSTDETLRAASVFPGLRVIRQDRNLGFLGNCNAAAAEARGEALLFLNNDTIVLPGWLTELVRVLHEEPTAAIVGSKLLYPDGTIQETGGVLFSDASAGNLGRGKPRRDPLFSFDREVDYSTGASILVRRSFWDSVGGFSMGVTGALAPVLDLSLSARHSNLHVICAAKSEMIHHPAQTSAGLADISNVPKPEMLRPLLSKWNIRPEHEYLPPATPPEIAAAHAERMPFSAARRRREGGRLNVLYFSPFPSHPDNHGNQATIQSFGKRFQKLGHKVHFALLQSNMYDATALEGMRSTWDTLDLLPNSRQLWANGNEIPFDGWYEPGLGENIRLLCSHYDIDVVFCSYIFQSKLLEFVPAHVLRVIDTHDKMGDRYEMLRKNGQPLEFFSCTPEQEGAYLRRADVVVARRAEEAEYFNSVSQQQTAIVIPHFEEPRFEQRRFEVLRTVGLVASANRINLAIMLDFVRSVARATAGGKVPFQVHIAGQVRDMIGDLPSADQAAFAQDWITLHGFVPDIADFYAQMDLILSPVTMGTGINVKTVQAMAYGMPLLTTAWGCKGIETGDPMHSFASMDDLVGGLMEVQSRPEVLEHLASVSRDRYSRFLEDSMASFNSVLITAKRASRTGASDRIVAGTRTPAFSNSGGLHGSLPGSKGWAEAMLCFCGGKMVPLEQFGKPAVLHWSRGKAPAYVCSKCSYVGFQLPSEDELTDYYQNEYGLDNESYYTYETDHESRRVASRSALVVKLARTYHSEEFSGTIVELGCAYGGPVLELRRQGHVAFGLDLNSRAISEGRSRGNAFIYDLTPEQLTKSLGIKADFIYSFHMLEHVRDLRSYLKSLDTLLNDGGVAFFRVPNGSYLRAWLQGFATWDWFAFPDHLHMLTPVSVAALVRECGFELLAVRSNSCGEVLDSIVSWLPEAARQGESAIAFLEEAGCLSELEFVFRKPASTTSPVFTGLKAEAMNFVQRSEVLEAEIKVRPRALGLKILG